MLEKNRIKVTYISDITGFPEMMGGRVKTLHPNVFGGILANRKNKANMKELKKLKIECIDLVVVNFYPFEETLRKTDKIKEIIKKIDIGGPSLARAAAKNHQNVLVVVDPKDYDSIIDKIKSKKISDEYRLELAAKAFEMTAGYDAIISNYFNGLTSNQFPETLGQVSHTLLL